MCIYIYIYINLIHVQCQFIFWQVLQRRHVRPTLRTLIIRKCRFSNSILNAYTVPGRDIYWSKRNNVAESMGVVERSRWRSRAAHLSVGRPPVDEACPSAPARNSRMHRLHLCSTWPASSTLRFCSPPLEKLCSLQKDIASSYKDDFQSGRIACMYCTYVRN